MKLSIIIPHHSETKEQIHPLLNSIDSQVGIDFNDIEVILCCDNETSPLDDCDFSEYKNLIGRITKLKSPYRQSPGMSRQVSIDLCNGDYVFFCDADDCLYHVAVIRELIENIENTKADVYRFNFIEEVGSFYSDVLQYQMKNHNWVWVFAKAYRKEWLKENNIRFNETIRWHEDTYFNLLCQSCNPKTIDINDVGYLWRFSKTSVTRVGNHEYTFNSIDEYLDAVSKAFVKITNEYHKNCSTNILNVINTYYKTLMHPDNKNQNKYEYIESCFYKFIKRFASNLFNGIPIDIQKYFAQLVWSGDRDFLPELSLSQYLKYLFNKYEINVGRSNPYGKQEISKFINDNFNTQSEIIDIGCGGGTWRDLLPKFNNIDGVDIYKPNCDKVKCKYRNVYNEDISDFKFDKKYDLAIMCDVLEHMSVEDAKNTIENVKNNCMHILVSVPYKYPQGELYGNDHEKHIQDDLTKELFDERYPGFNLILGNDSFGYYFI